MEQKRFWQTTSFLAHNSAIVGITMSTTVIFAFATLYLRQDLQVSNFKVGLAIGLSHLVSIIFSPIAGVLSDAIATPWGRRRPFLVVGAMFSAFFLILLPFTDSYLLFLIILSLFFLFSVGYQIPFYALIPEVAPEGQRGKYTIFTGLLRFLGFALVLGFGGWLWQRSPVWLFGISGVFIIVTALITVVTVREGNNQRKAPAETGINLKDKAKMYIDDLAGHKEILLFLMAQFIWWFGLGALLPFATIIMKELYHVDVSDLFRPGLPMVAVVLIFASSVIGAGILGDRWGHRKTISTGLMLLGIASFLAYFASTMYIVYVIASLIVIGSAPLLNEPLALLAELIPKGREGEFYGLDTISITLSQVPAAIISGAVIDRFGHPAVFLLVTGSCVLSIVFMQIKAKTKDLTSKAQNKR